MNRAANRNLLEGRVTNRLRPRRALGREHRADEDQQHHHGHGRSPSPNSTGREKKIVNSCTWGLVRVEPSLGSYQRATAARARRTGPACPKSYLQVAWTRWRHSHDPEAGAPPGGPFAALGRFAVRRRWPIVVVWAAAAAGRDPVRAAGRRCSCGPAASSSTTSSPPGRRRSSRTELDAPPSAVVVVLHSDSLARRARRRSRPPRRRRSPASPDAPYVARIVPHTLATAPGLGRRPHRLRRRAADDRPGRLAGRAARDPRPRSAIPPGSTSRWPAGRRSTATSRPSRSPTCGGAS